VRIKLPSLSTLIFLFIIYKCVFSGDGDEEVNVSGTGGGGEPNYQIEEKTKEVLDKASDLIDKAKEKYIKKEETIGEPVDISVFGGKDNNPKNEKSIEEPSTKKQELEKLDIPTNKIKEEKPMFKSID
jgi:hypothetical protein